MDKGQMIANWKKIRTIEDGCGGVIYKIFDISNSELNNLEIAMCIFNPGELAELHYHKVMQEIYFIIDGEGEIEMNGSWYSVKAEDSIAIPVNTKHRIRNTSTDKPLRFLSINSPNWKEEDMIRVDL